MDSLDYHMQGVLGRRELPAPGVLHWEQVVYLHRVADSRGDDLFQAFPRVPSKAMGLYDFGWV